MTERKFNIQEGGGTVRGNTDAPFIKFLAENHSDCEVPVDMDIPTVDFILRKLREHIDNSQSVMGADQQRGLIAAWNLISSLKRGNPP